MTIFSQPMADQLKSNQMVYTLYSTLPPLEELITGSASDGPTLGVNAHIHLPPNFSAFETVSQAVGLAADQSVKVLGANNYYDYTVYTEMARL